MALRSENCCFLFQFYIKPQLNERISAVKERCFLFQFYIKPQRESSCRRQHYVVSYFNSTSNHNMLLFFIVYLLVVSYFNSTSNHNRGRGGSHFGTVVSYFNSTSNHNNSEKPPEALLVVSYFNSTSNHNLDLFSCFLSELFLISILHQTTTSDMRFVDCHSVMWPNERYERRMTGRGSRNDAGFVFQRYFSLKVECTSRARNRYMFAK